MKRAMLLLVFLPSFLWGQMNESSQIIEGSLEYKLDAPSLVTKEFMLDVFAVQAQARHGMSLVFDENVKNYNISIGDKLNIFGTKIVFENDTLKYQGVLENNNPDLPLSGIVEARVSVNKKVRIDFRIEVYGFNRGFFKNWIFRGEVKKKS